jgi:hypothetical protein
MCPSAETSPPARAISIAEFDAGTWRKDELIALARTLSIPTKGTKADIADRIRVTLIRRSISTAVEVHTGTPTAATSGSGAGSTATPTVDARPPVRNASTDFFRETPGESRAKGLAAWFARRTASTPRR